MLRPEPAWKCFVVPFRRVWPSVYITIHLGWRRTAAKNHALPIASRDYTVAHLVPEGDDCSIFKISDRAIIDIIAEFHPAAGENPDAPFPFRDAPSSTRLFAFHRRAMLYA